MPFCRRAGLALVFGLAFVVAGCSSDADATTTSAGPAPTITRPVAGAAPVGIAPRDVVIAYGELQEINEKTDFQIPDADIDCAVDTCVVVQPESARGDRLWDPATALLTVLEFVR
ncbi:MAG: hypothetical protein HKN26_08915 [Acidimicrobiales bacterium]|nr:hypothetical protein [Acidimicrobiales bacterium]